MRYTKKGSGIEEVAIAHQYQFEQTVFAKLQTAVNAKFQYHARRAIDRIKRHRSPALLLHLILFTIGAA